MLQENLRFQKQRQNMSNIVRINILIMTNYFWTLNNYVLWDNFLLSDDPILALDQWRDLFKQIVDRHAPIIKQSVSEIHSRLGCQLN